MLGSAPPQAARPASDGSPAVGALSAGSRGACSELLTVTTPDIAMLSTCMPPAWQMHVNTQVLKQVLKQPSSALSLVMSALPKPSLATLLVKHAVITPN